MKFTVGMKLEMFKGDLSYTLSPGFNIYLYNAPTFTPYIGGQLFYRGSVGYGDDEVGDKLYAGSHIFISENVAITPELGVTYDNFNERGESYFNTFLTCFF